MPVNRKWPLDTLLAACADYTKATKRIITFEYTVIKGVNDSRECAEELARQVKRVPMAKVNLIPLSPVSHRPDFKTPDERTMLMFLDADDAPPLARQRRRRRLRPAPPQAPVFEVAAAARPSRIDIPAAGMRPRASVAEKARCCCARLRRRRLALKARGVQANKAKVAVARELAEWVYHIMVM